jgi:hypothetical protein
VPAAVAGAVVVALPVMLAAVAPAAAVVGVGERGAAGDGEGSGGDRHDQAAWCPHELQLLQEVVGTLL